MMFVLVTSENQTLSKTHQTVVTCLGKKNEKYKKCRLGTSLSQIA